MSAFADPTARDLPWRAAHAVVLGLARSGEAAARALIARGATVTVLDEFGGETQRARARALTGARILLGPADPDDVTGADVVIASPGVPPSSPWLRACDAAGIPVWSEVELAYRMGITPAAGITGTNGKTTTVEMTVAALTAAGIPARAAGNIGAPLVSATEDVMVIAELSSFQLQGIHAFRTPVAALLNVAPDHLNWHGSFDAYVDAKTRIFENQREDDIAIFHADASARVAGARARRVPFSELALPEGGAGVEDGWIVVPQGRVIPVARLRARGRPNLADAIAAAACACALGAEPAAAGEGLASYEPRPHRVEEIDTVRGVLYINDSKATDPHATLAALEDLDRVVLIAGGQNKDLDMSDLVTAAPKLRGVIAIGASAHEIETAFAPTGIPVVIAISMDDAVERAASCATAGDTVLLSPACASWDMFANYEARGDAFRAAVRRLQGEQS